MRTKSPSGHTRHGSPLGFLLSAITLAALSACGGGGGAPDAKTDPLTVDQSLDAEPNAEALKVVTSQSLTVEQEIDRLRQLGFSVLPLDDTKLSQEYGDEEAFQFTPVEMPSEVSAGTASASSDRAFALSATSGEGTARPLIVGGSFAQPGQFPFFARLTISNGTSAGSCSASVLDANWVLTAAHCTPTTVNGTISVYLGYGSLTKPSETIAADYYVKFANDQALVHLSRPTTFPKIPYANTFDVNTVPIRSIGTGVDAWGGSSGFYKFVDSSSLVLDAGSPGYFTMGTANSMNTPCSGDSGGPNIAYTSTGFPFVVGVSSATLFPYCTGLARISRLDMVASSIQSITGVTAMQFSGTNAPPVIQQIQPLETPLQYTELQIAATDAEGDEILYEATGLPPGLSIHRLTGLIRGTPASYTLADQPSRPTVTVYDKTTGSSRSITFPWKINTPGNLSPQFNPISPRSILAGQALTFNVVAPDPDDSNIQYTATGLPPGVTVSSTGLVSGTASLAGAYQVNFSAVDGRGGYSSAPVLIYVQNTAPTVEPIQDVTSALGATNVRFTVTARDPDEHTVTAVASGVPTGVVFTAASMQFSGAPRAAGAYPISVRVSDGFGGATTRTFMWYASAANNRPPTMTPIDSRTALPGVPLNVLLSGMADPDGHAMTLTFKNLPTGVAYKPTTKSLVGTPIRGGVFNVEYTLADAFGARTTYPAAVWTVPNEAPAFSGPSIAVLQPGVAASLPYNLTDPENHVMTVAATNLPRGLAFNTITKSLSGTPLAGGSFFVTMVATDKYGAKSYTVTTNILVPNEAPVTDGSPGPATLVVGTVVNQPLSVVDPDGHPMTITALNRSLPRGLVINSATKSITGKPSVPGTYLIRLLATDRYGAKAEFLPFTWTVTNGAPVWSDLADQTSFQGSQVNLALPVSDPDGHTVTVTGTLPPGLKFQGKNIVGTVTAPVGTYTVVLNAKDLYNMTSPAKVISWTVVAPG